MNKFKNTAIEVVEQFSHDINVNNTGGMIELHSLLKTRLNRMVSTFSLIYKHANFMGDQKTYMEFKQKANIEVRILSSIRRSGYNFSSILINSNKVTKFRNNGVRDINTIRNIKVRKIIFTKHRMGGNWNW